MRQIIRSLLSFLRRKVRPILVSARGLLSLLMVLIVSASNRRKT